MYEATLPATNQYGCYEIRLESIGGLGANLSGKILGELGALYLGFNASSFSSYGSEKRGSPVKSFIRYAGGDTEIRLNSPVTTPHLLGLFHEGLAGKVPVTAGVDEGCAVVINTAQPPGPTRARFKLCGGTLFCVDAQQIAMACKTRVNMVMLGALARAAAFIPLEALEAVVRDTVGQKYPQALAGNLEGIRRGWEEARGVKIPPDPGFPPLPFRELEQELGWKTAPEGGVVTRYGSTVASDVSAGREGYVPVFKKEACIHCGLCDSTCPDMVFQFAPGEYKGKPAMTNLGPDYHHCKGCLRCTKICPTDALTPGLERDQDLTRTHVRNRDLRPDKMEFEDAGANSWMESESATVNEVY